MSVCKDCADRKICKYYSDHKLQCEDYKLEPENIFEKIADNEYTLAKWLSDMEIYFCSEISCSECIANKECWHQGNDTDLSNYDLWLSWLKRKL